jgi:hypothetical protein
MYPSLIGRPFSFTGFSETRELKKEAEITDIKVHTPNFK